MITLLTADIKVPAGTVRISVTRNPSIPAYIYEASIQVGGLTHHARTEASELALTAYRGNIVENIKRQLLCDLGRQLMGV